MSAKRNLKSNRRSRYLELEEAVNANTFFEPKKNTKPPVTPKNRHQVEYYNAMRTAQVTIGAGPAGTGKTLLATDFAATEIMERRKSQLILVRPAIESGASLGLLPGTLEDKIAPYLAPVREYLIDRMGKGAYEMAVKEERISPQPLGYMRGSTFKDCVVIVDEAQNITPAEMKMLLTRIGDNCVMIINGDVEQCDLKGDCGLEDAIDRIEMVEGVVVVEFDEDDCLRSPIVKAILKAYRYD